MTPAWLLFLLDESSSVSFAEAVLKIAIRILLPLSVGQFAQHMPAQEFLDERREETRANPRQEFLDERREETKRIHPPPSGTTSPRSPPGPRSTSPASRSARST